MKRKTHPNQSHPFRLHRFSLSHVAALPTLASNRLIAFAATSLLGMFLPIFWYEFFGMSITYVLFWYLADFIFKLPFFILAAKAFTKIGLRKSMIVGQLGLMVFYVTIYMLDVGTNINSLALIIIGLLGLAVVSTMYWSPFMIDFADFTTKGKRGRQVSIFNSAQKVIGVIGPLVAAFIIIRSGYDITFLIGLFLVAASIVPILFLPRHNVTYEFGYLESWKELFSKEYRSMTTAMAAYGAESVVGVVIWPIFLFTVFKGDYLEIGGFAAIIVIISIMLELFIGKETDRFSAKKMMKIGSGVYALGWVFKGLVQTIVGVFAASTFHSLGAIMLRTPMETLVYEQAADSGHYIDEYTVLREMALCLGRIVMMVFLIIITLYFSISASFFLAAIVSLGINKLVDYQGKQM